MTALNTFRNNSAEFLFHQKHLICSCKNTEEENYLDQNRFVKLKNENPWVEKRSLKILSCVLTLRENTNCGRDYHCEIGSQDSSLEIDGAAVISWKGTERIHHRLYFQLAINHLYFFYKSSPKTQSEIHQKSPSKISNKYHFHIFN